MPGDMASVLQCCDVSWNKSMKSKVHSLLLPKELDTSLQDLIRSLRLAGLPINTANVIPSAKGIVLHKNVSLLKVFGGSVSVAKTWARSFLERLAYVERTAHCKENPTRFPCCKIGIPEEDEGCCGRA